MINEVDSNKSKEAWNTWNIWNTWPAFVWATLKNIEVRKIHASKSSQFIVLQWKYWWIDLAQDKLPNVYGNITINKLLPIFVDCSEDKTERNKAIVS